VVNTLNARHGGRCPLEERGGLNSSEVRNECAKDARAICDLVAGHTGGPRHRACGLSDELVETALRLESLEQWVPFVAEDRAVYQVSRQKRDAAFRAIVLANYGYTCAITG
jgi:hypothetical protein